MEYRKNPENAATHLPALMRTFEASSGDILEIGTGYYSTSLLHWMAQVTHRHVYSYENDPIWYEKAKAFESEFHHVFLVKDWFELPTDKHWGLVFIDQSPSNMRRRMMRRYANDADYIVAHDSEPETEPHYHLEKSMMLFKYRYNYTKLLPNTSVVSNFFDVSSWQ